VNKTEMLYVTVTICIAFGLHWYRGKYLFESPMKELVSRESNTEVRIGYLGNLGKNKRREKRSR
jgi:hypothetical protein